MPATPPPKSHALGFSADAFLIPGRASKDALFDLATDDAALRDLMPTPETVRDAILECKKQGLCGTFSSGLTLRISGDVSALFQCFGVRLVLASDEPGSHAHFEDPAGKQLDRVSPINGHPLEKYIVSISVVRDAELTNGGFKPVVQFPQPPQAPQEIDPKPWYVWPGDLAKRMSVRPSVVALATAAEYELEITVPPGCCVAVVDSGVATDHKYLAPFRDNNRFIWPPDLTYDPAIKNTVEQLQKKATEGLTTALNVNTQLEHLWKCARTLQDTWGEYFDDEMSPRPSNQATSSTSQLVNDSELPIVRLVKEIQKSRQFNHYLTIVGTGRSEKLSDFLDALLTSFTKRSKLIVTSFDAIAELGKLVRFVEEKLKKIGTAIKWLETIGTKGQDVDGHGTGMAASILGVAKNSFIATFPVLFRKDAEEFSVFSRGIRTGPAESLEIAVAFTSELDKGLKFLRLKDKNDPSCSKVVSNSYGSFRSRDKLSPELNDLQTRVTSWVKDKDVLIVFSAGNCPGPGEDPEEVSIFALSGEWDAIIVGGAWDKDRANVNEPDKGIYLSNAAQGDNVHVGNRTFSFPDTCGLVGPEIEKKTAKNEVEKLAPYVYIPSKAPNEWYFGGGGTSSACAQVAGLCGALRAKYPNLSAPQIKAAIVKGGDALTDSDEVSQKSSQGRKPSEIGNPKLANIIGAFYQASLMSNQWVSAKPTRNRKPQK